MSLSQRRRKLEVETHDVVIEVLVKAAFEVLQANAAGAEGSEVFQTIAIGSLEGEPGVPSLCNNRVGGNHAKISNGANGISASSKVGG